MSHLEEQFEQAQDRQERDSKRNGIIITTVVHSLIILFFMITMAWVAPDPPLPKYGIEVNFGFEGTEGSGNIQNKTNPNKSESLEKAKPNPQPKVTQEETKPDPTPDPVEEVEPVKTDPIEDITTDEADEAVEAPKKEEQPKPKEEKPKKEEKGSSVDNTGTADEDLANNDGNTKDEVGDEGKKDGDVNADALLGGGSGGGASLSLNGWKWAKAPNNVEQGTETGTVVIKFKIDDEGTVVSASVKTRTVSFATAEKYRQYVEDVMYFIPEASSGHVSNFTYGSITFRITSK